MSPVAARWLLTELVPQLPTLVRHAGALLPPQREPRVGHELLRDERQHPGAVGVSHPQHLPHLKHTAKPRGGAGQLLSVSTLTYFHGVLTCCSVAGGRNIPIGFWDRFPTADSIHEWEAFDFRE